MRRLLPLHLSLSLMLSLSCAPAMDNPTQVLDLRVLGVTFEPPELFAANCQDQRALSVFASPVTMTTLLSDPAGEGRAIEYELFACASTGDRTCGREQYSRKLTSGTTGPGELVIREVAPGKPLSPGSVLLDGSVPLLQEVARQDPYRGLGGLRMPLVLHVKAGEEEIWAQKLLVFSCKLLPEMAQNRTPVLPGLRLLGEPWPADALPVLEGEGPFMVEPEPFEDLQEPYVVPSFTLSPVQLTESWKISWRADVGRMSVSETGGTNLDGRTERHRSEWHPAPGGAEGEVTLWAVVRDGRGGESWLMRKAHWKP